jgi:photosystem II stability/assembly factor-like uncharacterized protein
VVESGGQLEASRDGGASWQRAGEIPGSGFHDWSVLRVDPRNRDVLYFGTAAAGGVFRSVDGGRTWEVPQASGGAVGPSRVGALAVDPSAVGVVYAGSQAEGLWKSTDAGRSWRLALVFPGPAYSPVALAVDPRHPRRVFAAAQRGGAGGQAPSQGDVWRSQDGGENWSRVLTTAAIYSLAIDPTDPRVLYVGLDRQGVLKSVDGGTTWRPARRGLRAYSVQDVAPDPREPEGVWIAAPGLGTYRYGPFVYDYDHPGLLRSGDRGQSWVVSDHGIADHPIARLVVDPARSARLWAFGRDRYFRSRDAGASWEEVAALRFQGFFAAELAVDPGQPDRVFAAGLGREVVGESAISVPVVMRTEDGGESWTAILQFGLGQAPFADGPLSGLALDPRRPETIYTAGATGFFRSHDAGDRWLRVGAGLEVPDGCPVVGQVAVDPFVPRILYAVTCDLERPLYRSTDRGAHWSPTSLRRPDAVTNYYDLLPDPHRPATLYLASSAGLFVTEDRGGTWRRFDAGLPRRVAVRALAADPQVPGRLYAGLEHAGLFVLMRSE